jgi:valyl-tRNA synthetase
MKKLAAPALDAVMSDEISFHPAKFKNLYRHWMEGIKDWCISRQLWWGHRIPAWYDEEGNFYVAHNEAEVNANHPETKGKKLTQDADCLDTWFSSWLWPFEVFKGLSNPGNAEVNYYYPTSTLVTAPEIIFFWVARMIMAGEEYMGKIPFKDVYFTGIVRDKQGRKMSKSLGNSPDLLGLIDQYGADAVRFGIMIASPAGNDLLFDESTLEQGRNFNNKLWNATTLLKMWEARQNNTGVIAEDAKFAMDWFEAKLNTTQIEVDEMLKTFRLSEALKTIYGLIWDDFCSWYLEWVKPGFEKPMDQAHLDKVINNFEMLLERLHPFMPFVTEEIYHLLREEQNVDLCVRQLDQTLEPTSSHAQTLKEGEVLKSAITAIRDARVKAQIKNKDAVEIYCTAQEQAEWEIIRPLLSKQVNASAFSFTTDAIANSIQLVVGSAKLYIKSEQVIDTSAQRKSIEEELAYYDGFLASVEKKLSNEKFVQNAKAEVVEMEKKKQHDAQQKIAMLKESLANLG